MTVTSLQENPRTFTLPAAAALTDDKLGAHVCTQQSLSLSVGLSVRLSVCVPTVCQSSSQVRLLFAPPGLAGLDDDCSLSAVRLLFLFSASFPTPPPPAAVPPSPTPPFSLSRSLSLSRVLLARSDSFTEELLPVMERPRWFVVWHENNGRDFHTRSHEGDADVLYLLRALLGALAPF